VFVGNLSFDTTSSELEQLFASAGEVVKVVLPTDRETGRPRGFGFVEFASDEAAEAAISKFHNFEHRGRNLRVNEAEERPQGAPGGGGGGFNRSFGAPDQGRRPPRPKGSRRNIRGRKRGL
jgi:RNA recognition motif-containing protein